MPSRRSFLKTSGLSLATAGPLLAQDKPSEDPAQTFNDSDRVDSLEKVDPEAADGKPQPGSNPELRVALVGCGGRGRGAAVQALRADPDTRLVALADAFPEPIASGVKIFSAIEDVASRVDVPEERKFVGIDCCERLLAEVDVDVVLLCSPPFFRPSQYAMAIDAGKHVFAEKPVATDVVGIKSVLETSRKAAEKNLSVVSGLCWRYETGMIDTIKQIQDGVIGRPIAAHSVRYSGLVGRSQPREASKTEFEHQLRNWYFYTWLSGDFIVEQFVHDLDMVAWAMGEYPTGCVGTGGRETRPAEQGNIFDHFAVQFEFPSGARFNATTRHQNGTENVYFNSVTGTDGTADLMGYKLKAHDGSRLYHNRSRRTVMHQLEHDEMYKALRAGERLDNSDYMIQSTLMGILGREAAYTGKKLSTEKLLASDLSLQPSEIAWDAEPPAADVAVPGITTLDRSI